MSEIEPSVSIHDAQPEDVARIVEMVKGMAEYENLTHQLQLDESTLTKSLFCDNPVPRALVARLDGYVIAYAIYFYNYSTFIGKPGIYLEDLYVDLDYRGKGVGDALFKAVAKIAYEKDCGRMEWMALDWNTPALRFYEARGAKKLGEWRLLRFTREELATLVG